MINCVYIHVPFCEKKCNYCSFCSFNALKKENIYTDALLKEINFYYKKNNLKTIYFGGGTPSLLNIKNIEKILNCFNFDNKTEITIEINPLSVDLNKLKEFKNLGINRISVGVQTFNNNFLKILGRNHLESDIYKTIDNILKVGFSNFSVDLIYGIPEQKENNWIETLNKAIKLNPHHISLYGLKIEKGTYFEKFLPKNLPNADMQAKMYEIAINLLKEKYIHYEFSSFAKSKDYFSKHNSAYWKRENYWGFGLSASGFVENKRYTNTFNFSEYLKNPIEKKYQKLTKKEEIEEEIFLGLRMLEGINFEYLNQKYGINIYNLYKKEFNKYLKFGFMEKTEKGIKLSLKGIELSNEILCDFV